MKYVEWIIDEEAEQRGISAISLVEHPAIESDWVTLSKQEPKPLKLATVDEERQIVMGAILVPKKQILRIDDAGNEYYGFFSEETVRRAAELLMIDGKQKSHTFEHQEIIHGCTIVELWVVDDPTRDKAAVHGIDIPKGTCMACTKVHDKTIWNEYIKTGIVKGFSIEGYFKDGINKSKEAPLSIVEDQNKMEKVKKSVFKNALDKAVKELFGGEVKLAEANLADGSVIFTPAEAFAIGVEVQVDIDGEMQAAADGEYALESGEVLVVAEGVVSDILTKEEEMTEEEVQAQLSEIISNAVVEATKELSSKIESLSADMETLKAEKATVETELSAAKTELAKTPATVIPRKEELTVTKPSARLPKGVAKSFEKFKQHTK